MTEPNESLMKEDLYKLFDVDPTADTKTIRKAYRQMAKTCHPDKNPDDKNAAEKFHKLAEALKILVDEDLRIKYDVKRKAKIRQEEVLSNINKARRTAKEDLEMRETLARMESEKLEKNKSKAEKLREEAANILKEEMRLMQEEIDRERKLGEQKNKIQRTQESQEFRLKVKYNPNSMDKEKVEKLLNEQFKSRIYSKPLIAFSTKKRKSEAIVETQDYEKARKIINNQIDPDNLLISWYDTPIPPTDANTLDGMTQQQKEFFLLEANVLTALRKKSRL